VQFGLFGNTPRTVDYTFPEGKQLVIDGCQLPISLELKRKVFVLAFGFSQQKNCENNWNFNDKLRKRKVYNMEPPLFAICRCICNHFRATFRQILMRKVKVYAKIRKRKLLFQLYISSARENVASGLVQ
jgi:hypothetical protein